jgi:hypothetical protein
VTTLIGYGSPNKAGTHDVHGAALGQPETDETRENLGWNYPPFELPDGVVENFSRVEEVNSRCNFPMSHPSDTVTISINDCHVIVLVVVVVLGSRIA